MSDRLHVDEICEHLKTATLAGLTAAPPTGLGLTVLNYGGLEYYPADYAGTLDALLIKPVSVRYRPSTMQKVECSIRVRLVYARRYANSENIVEKKVENTAKIVEAVWTDWLFSGLSLTNGQLVSCLVTDVDYEPKEDFIAFSLGQTVSASAVIVESIVSTNRRTP
jgi:hypothetical protein